MTVTDCVEKKWYSLRIHTIHLAAFMHAKLGPVLKLTLMYVSLYGLVCYVKPVYGSICPMKTS